MITDDLKPEALEALERRLLGVQERRQAAQSLIKFTEHTFARYQTAEHHRIIAGQLERVERGEIDRLMLLVPPRHGKSELASKRFPAWLLGRQPHKQFLSISATAELAADFGREVRNLIGSPEYKSIFPTTLAEDSQAKGKWHTAAGGIYYSLGVGGSVLGRGGDCILIDDPFETSANVGRKTSTNSANLPSALPHAQCDTALSGVLPPRALAIQPKLTLAFQRSPNHISVLLDATECGVHMRRTTSATDRNQPP